ncbi:MAG: hypothetical protein JST36_03090 [Bacteroidetes bacterium]|nr:hypothetical protein [Bacteroidota bacterium]
MRVNKAPVGLLLGLIFPLLGYVVVFFILGRGGSFSDFSSSVMHNGDLAGKVISLAVLANLIPFLYFNKYRRDQTVKGIVIATCLYMTLFVYMKYVL